MSDFPNYVAGRRAPNNARQLQNVVDAAEGFANLQVQAPLTMTRHGRIATLGIRLANLRPSIVQGFTLLEMFGDYMLVSSIVTSKTVALAKPPLLRRSPFDSLVPEPPPDRLGIHYEYIDAVTRDAIRGEGDDEEREHQIVIQHYVLGDILIGIRTIYGGTGVTAGEPGAPVSWLDLNVDGREFTKVPG